MTYDVGELGAGTDEVVVCGFDEAEVSIGGLEERVGRQSGGGADWERTSSALRPRSLMSRLRRRASMMSLSHWTKICQDC